MRDLVKGLQEVQKDSVCLLSGFEIMYKLLCGKNELGFS